jgi:LmbE family N-acetylglucosaminyl deacetylase
MDKVLASGAIDASSSLAGNTWHHRSAPLILGADPLKPNTERSMTEQPGAIPNRILHPKRALSIQAHPDDQEFSVAGTLALWVNAGAEVCSVIITSGDSGSNDPKVDASYKPILSQSRQQEQLAANAILGIKETIFLGYPDGTLQPTLDLRRALTRVIRLFKPDVVICGDPTIRFYGNSYINHPDHRAAAEAAVDAVFPSAETRLIFPELLDEGLLPHKVSYLCIHGSEKTDMWVDISATIDLKIRALMAHHSQIGDWDPGDELKQWAAGEGKSLNIPYAESFRVMILHQAEEGQ